MGLYAFSRAAWAAAVVICQFWATGTWALLFRWDSRKVSVKPLQDQAQVITQHEAELHSPHCQE